MISKDATESAKSPFQFLLQFWSTPMDFQWGTADASVATRPSRVGNRIVPDRIEVRIHSADGQPSLSLDLQVVDGIPQCRGLALSSVSEGRAIRPVDLDSIKLDEWVADAFAAFAFERQGVIFERLEGGAAGQKQDIAAANDFQRARRGKGARIVNAKVVAKACEIYIENYEKGGAIKAVAAAFGVSERTASSWITLGRRKYGYLPETKPGQKKI